MSSRTLSEKWSRAFGMTIQHSADWSTVSSSPGQPHSHTLKSFFHLPVASDRLFCISRGDLSSGSIRFTQSHRSDLEDVLVQITVESDAESLFEVCELKKKEGQRGVGIFTPTCEHELPYGANSSSPSTSHLCQFSIIVEFPNLTTTMGSHLLEIKNWETDMPLFSLQVDNLAPTISFRAISLRTSHMPILVDSLRARKAYCETSNASIEGTFVSSEEVKLVTANARIRVSVRLESTDPGKFSGLVMSNSNGPIFGSITLSAPQTSTSQLGTLGTASSSTATISASEQGGNFSINASTNNSPLTLIFPSAPKFCNLHLRGTNSLGLTEVSLPGSYEGSFKVSTSTEMGIGMGLGLGRAEVVRGIGMGRAKVVSGESSMDKDVVFERDDGECASGWVCWTDSEEGGGRFRGDVEVETSMEKALIRL